MEKYPGRVPVVVEDKQTKTRSKFLIPSDMTAQQFIILLKRKLYTVSSQSIFMFVRSAKTHVLIIGSSTFGEIYNQYKGDDGFLYIVYSNDSVFGC